MGQDDQNRGRYATRSTDGDGVEVYDTENDEAWIRSDVTEKLSWMV